MKGALQEGLYSIRPRKTSLTLIGEVLQKVGCAVLVTACLYDQISINVDEAKEYVRIVAGGVPWFLPTPMGKRREYTYVCMFQRLAHIKKTKKKLFSFHYIGIGL